MNLLKTFDPLRPLSQETAAAYLEALLDPQAEPLQVGASLALLSTRTPEAQELGAFAEVLRARAIPFAALEAEALDTCGTGGDGASTANLSTLAALALAALGVPVVKHGNRAATSSCGSADLLEALGYALDATPADLRADLRERRFAFLFAPAFHPALGRLRDLRGRLGIPTVFNLLGPLLNPGRPAFQVLGVAREELLEPMAGALARLGLRRAFVIHGRTAEGRGLDEASISGPTRGLEVVEGRVARRFDLDPASLGLPEGGDAALQVASREEAVAVAMGLAGGESHPHHRPEVARAVALQAALGLLLHRGLPVEALRPCLAEVRTSLRSGFALPFPIRVR